MKFLVDANVLSEAVKPIPEPKVLAWLSANETELAINPIVLGELQYGILLLPVGKKRDQLRKWLLSGIQYLAMLDYLICRILLAENFLQQLILEC